MRKQERGPFKNQITAFKEKEEKKHKSRNRKTQINKPNKNSAHFSS